MTGALPLADRTIEDVTLAMEAGEVTSRELTEACLGRIRRDGARLNTFLAVDSDRALAAADAADAARRDGDRRPLLGVPYALKDIFVTRALDDDGRPNGGLPTTAGSRILQGFCSPYASDAEDRLDRAGAVLIGKTNCDEFAMGSSTENSAYGPVRNPWDEATVPGGSSGGSSAAVAAGQAFFALGTDTGGSIRQPAALSGIVGLKPTYGRVSRFGMVAFASSLDQCGPFARSVRDVAAVLGAVAGHDPRDSTSVDVPVPDYVAELSGDVRGMRIGVPREYFVAGMQPGVEAAVRAAIDHLAGQGAEIVDVSLPSTDLGLATYYIIAPAEASANLARYDGIRYGPSAGDDRLYEKYLHTRGEGFGPEVKRRIMLGTYALSAGYYDAYYVKAQQVRTLIKREFDEVLSRVDALVAPASPEVAFRIGAKADDPLAMYLSDACTLPVNIAGLPGVVLPCGLSDGKPVGLQVIGPAFGEAVILCMADAYERSAGFADLRPPTATAPAVAA
ncbi:MAG: Asp-tRNA(Asn)/Glu-tRNA(Gln) amidotransferase subunit GatA [Candidatus Limnocylindria bacterium]